MSIFRVEKNKNYTTMCNYHLRDPRLSLKAKGLLSLFLSLPDTWTYSVSGLAAICREGKSGIGSGLAELEKAGYLTRERRRDENGQLHENIYVIYEKPQDGSGSPITENPVQGNPVQGNPVQGNPAQEKPVQEKPMQGNPAQEKPVQEKPTQEKPVQENRTQLNKDISSKDISNTDLNNQQIEKEPRRRYGEYGNVLLSDEEYQSLQKDFPGDYNQRIEELSEYVASTGRLYQNHLATIRSWANRKREESKTRYSHDNYRCEEGDSL